MIGFDKSKIHHYSITSSEKEKTRSKRNQPEQVRLDGIFLASFNISSLIEGENVTPRLDNAIPTH